MSIKTITIGEEVECYSPFCNMGVALSREVSILLGISQSTCSRICIECVPHVEPLRGGHLKAITPAQRGACVRAITTSGLDNVVDTKYVFSEHLNVAVSTNMVRRALHEVGLWSLHKQEKPLLVAKNVHCRLEFA